LSNFKLIPYRFRIHLADNPTGIVPFINFDGGNNDFLTFLLNKISSDAVNEFEHIFQDTQRSMCFRTPFNSKRVISGILEYGEYGIIASFLDVSTKKPVKGFVRKPNHSEKYPFFFYIYIPNTGSEGILIFQSYRNYGIKTTFEQVLNLYLESFGLKVKMNRMISKDLLDQINNSRLIQFKMIRKDVSQDIADRFSPHNRRDVTEIHSIVAKKNKNINLAQAIKDALTNKNNGYYEIMDEQYDEVKVLIDAGNQKRTLTFGNNDRYMESMALENVQLSGGFPVYGDLYDNATRYLKYILKETT
jgi:hypothetical protein